MVSTSPTPCRAQILSTLAVVQVEQLLLEGSCQLPHDTQDHGISCGHESAGIVTDRQRVLDRVSVQLWAMADPPLTTACSFPCLQHLYITDFIRWKYIRLIMDGTLGFY